MSKGDLARKARAAKKAARARTPDDAARLLREADREKGERKDAADQEFYKKVDMVRRVFRQGTPEMLTRYLTKMTGGDQGEQMRILAQVPAVEKIRLMVHPENKSGLLHTREDARTPVQSGAEMMSRMGWRGGVG